MAQTSVAIVGAGPVGLTAALALSARGIECRVVDALDDVDRRMRASTFHPPTLDMIDALGLGKGLVERGLVVPVWQLRRHETGEHVDFDLATIADATAHPFRLQIEQHHYCDLVIAELRARGVPVEFSRPVSGVYASASSVRAGLADGGELTADWLIGADGARSVCRKALGLDYGGITHTHSSVLVSTTFPFHEVLDELADVSYCWSARGPFSLLRLRGRWRASLYPGIEDLDAAADESRIRDWFAYIHPDACDADIADVHPYRVHERCVDRFRLGRVLLAGDAAHLNPPSGGMGMNGGIHDAISLCDKLAQVIDGEDEALLDRYDRQRRFVAASRVIPQASANRERMATKDADRQQERLDEHRRIATDGDRRRDFLLRTSMITGLGEAAAIA